MRSRLAAGFSGVALLVSLQGFAFWIAPALPGTNGVAPGGALSPTRSYIPLRGTTAGTEFDTAFDNMDYNGGPVMASNTDYLIFWSPSGFGAYGSGSTPEYVSGLEQYLADLAHDNGGHANTDSVASQYNDRTGEFTRYEVTSGGGLLDTDSYPVSQCPHNTPVTECLTDAQIQAELYKFTTAQHLVHDLRHEYFLLTPPNVESCFSSDASLSTPYGGCSAGIVPSGYAVFCAYHGNSATSPMMIYAVDPYVTGNAGCDDGNHPNGPSDGALEGGLSHEHSESITDPIPNDAWTNGAGQNQGFEIGDQCDGQFGEPLGTALDGASYNQVINGHFYWYQEEWSNQGHACLQRYTLSGSEPVAKFSATAGSGTSMSLDASASSASGGIADYVWQFNDAFGAQTVEERTPTIMHTFPVSGAYSVGLTVLAADGLSKGAGGIVVTGRNGVNHGFSFTPASPAAGQVVTFSALAEVSRQPVVSYLWSFGDGAMGTGAKPTHAYARSGTYTIRLVLFSGVGSAFPGQGAAPIVSAKITVT